MVTTVTQEWLEWLYPDLTAEAGQIWVGGHADRFQGRTFTTAADAARYAQQLDACGGAGVYARLTTMRPVPAGRGLASDSVMLPGLALDLDLAGPGHAASDYPPSTGDLKLLIKESGLPEPSAWINSGGGRYAWWRFATTRLDVTDPAVRDRAAELMRRLNRHVQGVARGHGWRVDSTFDLARIWRLPGTTNRKVPGDERMCDITSLTSVVYTDADLAACLPAGASTKPASTKPASTKPASTKPASTKPASTESVLDRVRQLGSELAAAPHGEGNTTAARVAFMAGQYVGAGQIGADAARGILTGALDSWTFDGGAGRRAIEQTIARQVDEGARQPRAWTTATPEPPLSTVNTDDPFMIPSDLERGSARPVPQGAPADGLEVRLRVADLARQLSSAPESEGNTTASRVAFYAGQYVGAGQITKEEALTALLGALDAWTWNGTPRSTTERTIRDQMTAGILRPRAWTASGSAASAVANGQEEPERGSSWRPVDVTPILTGDRPKVLPELGRRQDGARVLYRGKEHAVASEPECGKTFFTLLHVLDTLQDGGRVVYVDFEDDEGTIVGRLLDMGCPPERLTPEADRFRYVRPEEAPEQGDVVALYKFADGGPDLVIFDGVTEGMALLGLEVNGQGKDGAAAWRRVLVRPALNLGAATLATDHVVKDKERRGRYAIGGQHKLAGLTGVMFMLEAEQTHGRDLKGRTRVLVTKDRNGSVRPLGKATDTAQVTHLGDLVSDGTVKPSSWRFYPPYEAKQADAGPFAGSVAPVEQYPKHIRMTVPKVLAWLSSQEEPVSTAAIKGNVEAAAARILDALEWLKANGKVAQVSGPRGAKLWRVVDPFDAAQSVEPVGQDSTQS